MQDIVGICLLHAFRLGVEIVLDISVMHALASVVVSGLRATGDLPDVLLIQFPHMVSICCGHNSFFPMLLRQIYDCLPRGQAQRGVRNLYRVERHTTHKRSIPRDCPLAMTSQGVQILSVRPVRRQYRNRLQTVPRLTPEQRDCSTNEGETE